MHIFKFYGTSMNLSVRLLVVTRHTGESRTHVRAVRLRYNDLYNVSVFYCALTRMLQVEEETELQFSWMGCMDGNNSAKRFLSAALQDNRDFASDYFLPWDEVEKFKDEVSKPTEKVVDDESEVHIQTFHIYYTHRSDH